MVVEREGLGERAALIGIVGNIFLAIFKFIVGIVTQSTAVVADAAHSFSDILTSALVLLGMRISRAPPDEKHPLGHGDVEPIVGLIVSITLVLVGFEFARHSLTASTRAVAPNTLAIYAIIIAILAKEMMSRYTFRVAEKIRSPALRGDAQHHRSDVYTSVVVLIALLGANLGLPALDPIAGFFVSLFIIKIGFDVGKENIMQLMGTVPSPELETRIRDLTSSWKEIQLVHKVRIHGIGAYFNVDLHVAVDETLSLREAHKIAHEIQLKLVKNIPEIRTALVHIEPYDIHHKRMHNHD
jgi:cation diffusion facilitator family transporter